MPTKVTTSVTHSRVQGAFDAKLAMMPAPNSEPIWHNGPKELGALAAVQLVEVVRACHAEYHQMEESIDGQKDGCPAKS